MLSEYSIEVEAEKIYNKYTKEYFQEVMSSYINGNFRSAIVVLWTVSIYDIILKLEELSTIYEDTKAKEILKKINSLQTANPKSPEWEAKLIEEIEKNTDIFETHEIVHLESLRSYRHISAHPTIKKNELSLFQPNKETTRGLIRNTLEILLTKPPLASKSIFINFLNDLAEKQDLFPNIESLDKYLKVTYFNRMPKVLKEYIFKELWKFTFFLEDEECDKNRDINLKIMRILLNNYDSIFLELIKKESLYFGSKIKFSSNIRLEFILILLGENIKIFNMLDSNIQTLLREAIKVDYEFNIIAFFLFDTIDDYLKYFNETYNPESLLLSPLRNEYILKTLDDNRVNKTIIDLFINSYLTSKNYNQADQRFSSLIEPIINYIDKSQMDNLISGITKNSQVYERAQAEKDHLKLKNKCDELDIGFIIS